eukprot:CAMPEP_0170517824 /NCGR_PEP_ID=MMETSP0209-20121228/3677_1 /TAXON_ID=665100 ORGANISM="Litonotus pictus, Strain P1" /NCGR_SAMPLE_ID=MMETSP0209 /ASSEMBLY_ACC=CAM_ASM_000301 /LENGTH=302 /DNA_ID=CAMNT_0010803171 /DNA_START=152 /DNA_END=1060 /DNA_ORIENTATION=+
MNLEVNIPNKRNKSIIGLSYKPFSGCGSGCGGGSSTDDPLNLAQTKGNKEELKLKSINYEIIQCIEEGKYSEGLELCDDYLNKIKEKYGETHTYLTSGLNNKAYLLKLSGKLPEAKEIYEQILEIYSVNPPEAENIAIVKQNLATLLRDLKEHEKALLIYEDLFTMVKGSLIRPHIAVNIYVSASGSYRGMGQFTVALNILDRAEKLIVENFGENSLPMAHLFNQKALVHMDEEKYDLALNLLKQSLEIKESILEKTHPEVLNTRQNITQVLLKSGDREGAQEFLDQSDIEIKNFKASKENK